MQERKYPVGIQTFERLRKGNYIYVDKTDLVWKITKESPYVFFSRPRRFGKSLLTTTLVSYFQGRKDLFEGLKIMELEKAWESYPVIHVDVSVAKGRETAAELKRALLLLLDPYVEIYGSNEKEQNPGELLSGLIRRAYEKTGKQVAVIIDEYDAPVLDVLSEEEKLSDFRRVMQEFYQPLKASEAMIKFCFLTGITRLSQMNIFSTLNNMTNVSLNPKFSAICGITEQELETVLSTDIEMMAAELDVSKEETIERLRFKYDGYLFSDGGTKVYNPYSLMLAFVNKSLGNYWFESGTPTLLFQQMQLHHTDITLLDSVEASEYDFYSPTEAMDTALPLLYQTGYLTIKSYDKESFIYTLGVPNQEVRVGLTEGLLPVYVGLRRDNVQTGFALKFWQALRKNDLNLALREMQAFFAGLPYVDGFKKKLENVSNLEGFYEWSMMLIFNMLNIYVQTEVRCAGGRADLVVKMPDVIYVIELKVNGTAQQAIDQIEKNGYANPYLTDGRKVVKVGVKFSTETKTIEEWIIK
jgi:hypothetical protein